MGLGLGLGSGLGLGFGFALTLRLALGLAHVLKVRTPALTLGARGADGVRHRGATSPLYLRCISAASLTYLPQVLAALTAYATEEAEKAAGHLVRYRRDMGEI